MKGLLIMFIPLKLNRTIVQNRNYYPVRRSQVNETFVEDYDYGSDVGSNNCRRVKGCF
jgi:spore coat protein D